MNKEFLPNKESASLGTIREELKNVMENFNKTYHENLEEAYYSARHLFSKTLYPHRNINNKESHLDYYIIVSNPDYKETGCLKMSAVLKFDDSEDYAFQIEYKQGEVS